MRLYHWTNLYFLRSFIIVILSAVILGCTAPRATQEMVTVNIFADNTDTQINITSGSSVLEALEKANISMGELDRVEPPLFTVLSDGVKINVIRVSEEYYIEQEVIPFEHQELRNEALPEGERRISQSGVNGLREVTYHRVFENGIEVSNNIIRTDILEPALPEVVMFGSRASFASIDLPGKLTYLSAGNAWMMTESTGNRNLMVSTGDLDGRIFSLSPDGKFLLFTRNTEEDGTINSLWIANLEADPVKLIDLGIKNIVHYAEFNSESNKVAYSTVEWRESAPGWQANNDLLIVEISAEGDVGEPQIVIEPNSGGVYGWWGTVYSWSPDDDRFLFSRPDGLGIFDLAEESITILKNMIPYQTGGNWAWIPGASWSPDGKVIYSVDHQKGGLSENGDEGSNQFDLIAIPLSGGETVYLDTDVGMFAFPEASPITGKTNFITTPDSVSISQAAFSLAYLQAVFPDQSATSGYMAVSMDRDGSNKKVIFPDEGAVGFEPQQLIWSPELMNSEGAYAIALIYNGNIWLVDTVSEEGLQITGDGLTSKIDWR